MQTGNSSTSGKPASRLRHALAFCLRVLIPSGPPVNLPDDVPPLPNDDMELNRLGRRFSNELFARLLLELPTHRRSMDAAYATGDYRRLRDSVHKLLGATAYCDAPELDTGLRELRLALQTGDRNAIDPYFVRAINLIDSTLRYSGYRGDE
jgi:two-component system sensor histidine kinase BarA